MVLHNLKKMQLAMVEITQVGMLTFTRDNDNDNDNTGTQKFCQIAGKIVRCVQIVEKPRF